MPLSRPYPAIAGVAAVLLVAGVVSYQTLSQREPAPPSVVVEADIAGTDAKSGLAAQPKPLAASVEERTARVAVSASAPPTGAEADSALDDEMLELSVLMSSGLSTGLTRAFPELELKSGRSLGMEEVSRFDRHDQGRDQFTAFDPNPVKVVAEEPVSTFSIDVDTASYAFMRASLNRGVLPQPDAVRVEELVNYFAYDYVPPESTETPFAAHVSLMPAPWNDATRLLHIGIKGYEFVPEVRPPANLVFLIDSSGSMDHPNKLPLLVNSLKLLLGALAPEDTVAIVTYAGAAGTVLAPTPVAKQGTIVAALENLWAGGSTAGAEGIRQAYLLAERSFVEGGINRVILATDGDFNVGITDPDALEGYIARKRASGVFLSVLGFGMGNYNDALMQRLAQNGNGNAAYIDTLSEARKVLVDEATSTLFPIAKNVKIQVEFNPALVSEYRLIGYETRMLGARGFSERQGGCRRDRRRPHGHRALRGDAGGLGRRAHRAAPLPAPGRGAARRLRRRARHGLDPLQAARRRNKHGDRAARDRGPFRRERGERLAGGPLRRRRGRLRPAPAGRALHRPIRLRRRDRRRPGSARRGPVRLPRRVPRPRPPGQDGRRHGAPALTEQ